MFTYLDQTGRLGVLFPREKAEAFHTRS